jgi:hypothetical protein
MKAGITGIGLWGNGLNGWDKFVSDYKTGFSSSGSTTAPPSPAGIPARERRRAPLTVKLAIEVIEQASSMALVEQHELCSVFSSAMGDSHITDYMCRTLAGDDKTLSPTKFHNSVHNTPSGYWSIGANNRMPSTFVSGCRNSFSIALLETMSLAISEQKPTVLAIYDVAFGQPLFDVCPISEDFAAALIIDPDTSKATWSLELDTVLDPGEHSNPKNAYLADRVKCNPSASALILCEMLAEKSSKTFNLPLRMGSNSSVKIALNYAAN